MATQNSTHHQRNVWLAITTTIVLVASLVGYSMRQRFIDWYRASQREPVPIAVNYDAIIPTNAVTNTDNNDNTNDLALTQVNTANTELALDEPAAEIIPPPELNLAIPFTAQAPHANWDLPYQEACEEASVLMAARFLQGRGISDANDADAAIVELVNYNVTELDQPIDTTAAETARIIEQFYGFDTKVLYDWTWDDVKEALAQGYPVILPAAGRELGNPNFTAPGPLYHMLVIKGYTDTIVITNDPGTRKGADYQYGYETLTNANHDWNGGNVTNGDKVIIIVKPNDEN